MPTVSCPHCQQRLALHDSQLGITLQCPVCSKAFSVKAKERPEPPVQFVPWTENSPPPRPQAAALGPPPDEDLTLPCPYCSEEINATARKCHHCGEMLDDAARRHSPPVDEPRVYPGTSTYARTMEPHRGALVLVLGIIGFVTPVFVLSILAWVFGSQDLRKMREGRMDPSGYGMTQAGYVLGIIATLLFVGAIAIIFVFFGSCLCLIPLAGRR